MLKKYIREAFQSTIHWIIIRRTFTSIEHTLDKDQMYKSNFLEDNEFCEIAHCIN